MTNPEIMKMIIGARIRSGLTKKQLAYKAKVHYVSLLFWESGKILPTIKSLELLADAMDLEVAIQLKPKK